MKWLKWHSLLRRSVSALAKIKQLEPIQFRYIKELDPDQKLRAGFAAEQVQKIIPEAVFPNEDGFLMIDPKVLRVYISLAKEELSSN